MASINLDTCTVKKKKKDYKYENMISEKRY